MVVKDIFIAILLSQLSTVSFRR